MRISLIIRLSQPSLAGVGAGAELGNIPKEDYVIFERSLMMNLHHFLLISEVSGGGGGWSR